MDVVYRVRRGQVHPSLPYSLRSLRNLAHDRVWFVGHRPTWARNVEHVATAERGSKWENLTTALRAACEAEVSERFVLIDDDMFLLEPIDEIPTLHRGSIRDVMGTALLMEYRRGMKAADELLRRLGIPEPLSYELHVPMVVEKAAMLAALDRDVPPGQARTMYGNLAGVGGGRADDVKVYGHSAGIPPGPFVSTASGSFTRTAKAGAAIRAMFPTPGPYEEA